MTTQDIQDEARRRLAALHGGHDGSVVEQKVLNSVIRHLVTPNDDTLHVLRCHLAILSAASAMKDSPPGDLTDDKHWPLPERVQLATPAQDQPQNNLAVVDLAHRLNDLQKAFEGHDHKPVRKDGTPIAWDDFVLRVT